MTYDEATRHATWDEALVYALGELAREQGLRKGIYGDAEDLRRRGHWVKDWALSRELTLADRDPYEFRLLSYPWASLPVGRLVLS